MSQTTENLFEVAIVSVCVYSIIPDPHTVSRTYRSIIPAFHFFSFHGQLSFSLPLKQAAAQQQVTGDQVTGEHVVTQPPRHQPPDASDG